MVMHRSTIKSKKSVKKPSKFVQSRLNLGIKDNKLTKCPSCEMSYSPNVINDLTTHDKYHDLHLRGRKWSFKWGLTIQSSNVTNMSNLTPPPSSSSQKTGQSNEYIVMINPDLNAELRAMSELMELVNNELNAPHDENDFWSKPNGKGKAFAYIKNERAVGVITMEVLNNDRGRWMIYENKNLIDHVRPKFILGISRIWVCRTQRSHGIATKLLEVAREHTIYGKPVEKWEVAWSQPTESGGKLASKYNGVKHKSGKLLLPCYL